MAKTVKVISSYHYQNFFGGKWWTIKSFKTEQELMDWLGRPVEYKHRIKTF